MRRSGATVNVKTVRGTLAAARLAGLAPEDIAREAGIDPALLDDADTRVAYDAWLEMWRIVGERSGDRLIALRCAQKLPKGHFDVIDYLAASSPDLETAMSVFCRYFALISTAVEHRLEGHVLRRIYTPGAFTRSPFPTEFGLGALVMRTREWSERPWRAQRIEFAHAAPSSAAEIEETKRLLDCKVLVYDAPESRVHFDPDEMRLRMRAPEPELCLILDGHARAALERMPRTLDVVEMMRDVLAKELRGGTPTLEQCARRMGIGARSLHRRLAEAGTSHSKLLDEVRHALALRYLDDATMSIGEVGFLLGFADASAFYRAFRRWTGRTPAQHRSSTTGSEAR